VSCQTAVIFVAAIIVDACVCVYVCLAGYLTCLYWRRSKGVPVPIKTLDVEVQIHIFLAVAIDWRLVTFYRLSCEAKPLETLRMERSRQVGEKSSYSGVPGSNLDHVVDCPVCGFVWFYSLLG